MRPFLLALLFVAGCGGSMSTVDADRDSGPLDAAPSDAASGDAGANDASSDAGATDTALNDATPESDAMADAAMSTDAGPPMTIAEVCTAQNSLANICSTDCANYLTSVTCTDCTAQNDALGAYQSDTNAWFTCRSSCPIVIDCRPTSNLMVPSCSCNAQCAMAGSSGFQHALLALLQCIYADAMTQGCQ